MNVNQELYTSTVDWMEDTDCSCQIDEFGETQEWCDNCMFGCKRASYYRARDMATTSKEQIQDIIVEKTIQYFTEDWSLSEEESMDAFGKLLRYLWDKQDYLRRHPAFNDAILKCCEDWEKESDSTPILSTVIATKMILSKIQ
jgi:hypothetical protein